MARPTTTASTGTPLPAAERSRAKVMASRTDLGRRRPPGRSRRGRGSSAQHPQLLQDVDDRGRRLPVPRRGSVRRWASAAAGSSAPRGSGRARRPACRSSTGTFLALMRPGTDGSAARRRPRGSSRWPAAARGRSPLLPVPRSGRRRPFALGPSTDPSVDAVHDRAAQLEAEPDARPGSRCCLRRRCRGGRGVAATGSLVVADHSGDLVGDIGGPKRRLATMGGGRCSPPRARPGAAPPHRRHRA